MDDLRGLKVFSALIEKGSLTAAARFLSMSLPMASKHLSALERHVGVRLIQRNSRRWHLTEAGKMFGEHALPALIQLEQAQAQLQTHMQLPQGELVVSLPAWMATPEFSLLLENFLTQYPEVLLRLDFDNRLVDMVAQGVDIVLRATETLAEGVIARPLAQFDLKLVACPSFIKNMAIDQPSDVLVYPAILPDTLFFDRVWLHHAQEGKVCIKLKASMRVSSDEVIKSLVLRGHGLAVLPGHMIANELAHGDLVECFAGWSLPLLPMYAVYTHRQQLTLKHRVFLNFVAEYLPLLSGFKP